MIKFWNTLTRKKQEFTPLEDRQVKFYTCGPTVYDAAHIGNLRSFIFSDLLKRVLTFNDYRVKQVMNITDIDDKTIKKSGGDKQAFNELTKKYEDQFWADFMSMNCLKPDIIAHATDYIDKMVKFIEVLIDKGLAYKGDDGSTYFSIAKFPAYGALSGMDKAELKSGARVAQDEYTKENPADFVLWKAWNEADGEVFWETPLGKGRPGWSIECSVMATDNLGKTLDIHTGGIDLVFPHHENEIAQSEGYSGVQFVRFWLHHEHLLVNNAKMAKSAGNFYVLDDIKEKGFSALDFRYLCLGAHYRSKINFTWNSLEGAKNSLVGIKELVARGERKTVDTIAEEQITEAFNNDLDTPKALALLHEAKSASLWLKFDEILGLGLKKDTVKLTSDQEKLIKEREVARKNSDFDRADCLRKELVKQGIRLEDTAEGPRHLTE